MEQFIKENGLLKKIKKMDVVYRFGQMVLDTTDSGEMAWLMARADLYMLKEMSMRENGLMIKLMDSVSTLTSTEADMKASGTRISSTDTV